MCITIHLQQFNHMIVIALNYTSHYSHRDNDDVEDLSAKDKDYKENRPLIKKTSKIISQLAGCCYV